MGLRCSLLGHDFGETEVEREREEQGSEVVETVREIRTCGRCGETKLVSENTNVTTLERSNSGPSADAPASDGPATAAEAGADASPADSPAAAESGAAEPTAGGEDAEILDDAAPDPDADAPDAADAADADPVEDVVAEAEAAGPSAEEDDGVILDETDEQAAPDREYGQWPDSDDTGDPEAAGSPSAWPEQDGEDRGYDAELTDEGADVEFGGGLTPEVDPDEAGGAGGETVGAPDVGETGITSAGTAPSPDGPADTTEVDTEFFCPECEQITPADRSSLRAGDICPECKHGYITERER